MRRRLEFLHYHDTEWGFAVGDDCHLFEKLSLLHVSLNRSRDKNMQHFKVLRRPLRV
ncbi:DNA-3-methyladenine glycosylase I [Sinorhizobium chiapasense]|uniref:DNA-3-methyladenine glycosylase I n=1 Tax=Sinorhizobium chiapasense TaxID=501572 RepID=A0ABZ2BHB1_9HYPH